MALLRRIQSWFWEISDDHWTVIHRYLTPGMRTLETGSGRSTTLFEAAGCRHVALEHDPQWRPPHDSVVLAPLTGDPPWYDWRPDGPFDLIFIDGPPGRIGRAGILRVLPECLHARTVVVLDDTERPAERELAHRIAKDHGLSEQRFRARWQRREFTVLAPAPGLR